MENEVIMTIRLTLYEREVLLDAPPPLAEMIAAHKKPWKFPRQ